MLQVLPVVLALTAGQSLPPWMTGQTQPADLSITLVTFSPGDSLVEWWGHTSFVVEDRRLNHARLYNFGMFGPKEGDTVGFVKDFAKGRLIFWVADDSAQGTFSFYKNQLKRDVRLQELDLEPDEAMAVAKSLGTNVLPENRMYRYHHYNDNCSTRPRDIIDAAIGGQLKAATSGTSRMTLRQHTLRYSMVNPPMSLVLDYLQADSLDKPITGLQDAYLPDELEAQLQALQVKRADGTTRPLVKTQRNWFKSDRTPPPATAPNWILYELLVGLFLAGIAHGLGHWGRDGKKLPRVLLGLYTSLIGLVLGILGLALGFLMTATDHDVTFGNENIFQANPLTFALFPLGLMLMWGAKRAVKWNRAVWTVLAAISVLGVLIKVLPSADQANGNILAILVPLNVGFAALWWLEARHKAAKPVSVPLAKAA
ncbi:MAG: DUF4105 domain-containing protein [Archangium sp.]|nr:DUF4105 domain-containing protein [Archangium sp.]MDP3570308.1 DUF4105 domain-containing protein [Archangium sp.]